MIEYNESAQSIAAADSVSACEAQNEQPGETQQMSNIWSVCRSSQCRYHTYNHAVINIVKTKIYLSFSLSLSLSIYIYIYLYFIYFIYIYIRVDI